jgi:pyruvate dehydrogenase E2 component (dihydrolipoamide acetyltransferase)
VPVEFKLPELGENIVSGDVVRVMVGPGDTVEIDQPVLEVETGKAVVEVPSSVAGKVVAVLVREGETAKVGQAVLTLESAGAGQAQPVAADSEPGSTRADLKPASTEASRVAPEAGPADGQVQSFTPPSVPPSRDVEVEPGASEGPQPTTVVQFPTPSAEDSRQGPILASPSVRQLAREIGVDVYAVPGSGPGGRVSVEDVKKYSRDQRPAPVTVVSTGPVTAAPSAPALPDFSAFGQIERQPMSAVRRATAEHLTTAWTVAPHVTQFDSADVTDLEALRKRWLPRAEKAGAKLTITAMLLKIVAAGLKAFPKLNASVDMQSHEVILKRYIHIGVAADTDRGLVVPVLRDADKKSALEIAQALGDLSARARDRKLKAEDMQGGTFTVTNLGGLGGKHFAPILNWPEVGILGVGRAAIQPVYVGDELKPRLMLPLALSYDHRLVDGADGTRFLRWLVDVIEDPMLLFLEG